MWSRREVFQTGKGILGFEGFLQEKKLALDFQRGEANGKRKKGRTPLLHPNGGTKKRGLGGEKERLLLLRHVLNTWRSFETHSCWNKEGQGNRGIRVLSISQ